MSTNRSRQLRKSPLEIIDSSILTAQEQVFIGGTPASCKMAQEKFIPQALLERLMTFEEVLRLRRRQGEIASHSASFFFDGINFLTDAPLIALSDIDSVTGEVVQKTPILVGIYQGENDKIIRDPEILKKYPLTEYGAQRLFVGELIGTSIEREI